jgi:hypothetical protein
MVILSGLKLGFKVDNNHSLMEEGGGSHAERREVPWRLGLAARWRTTKTVAAPCFSQRLGMKEVGLGRGWAEQEQLGRMVGWVGVVMAGSTGYVLVKENCKN